MQLKQKHPVSANRIKRSKALDFIQGNKILTVAFLGAFTQILSYVDRHTRTHECKVMVNLNISK